MHLTQLCGAFRS